MTLNVNVICRNYKDDRVLPRFSRYLAENLGWTLSGSIKPGFDAYYLSGYFEAQLVKKWPDVPVLAYFTHLEVDPPGNGKAKLFNSVAKLVDLRIVTAKMYATYLEPSGFTQQVHPPVERDKFVIPKTRTPSRLVGGFSGYTYRNGRKGEGLAATLIKTSIGRKVSWMASGRGWPVPTRKYPWEAMPSFYQGLDILVCPASVEGVPMPPLEALSCGVSVVVPHEVGLLDELPDTLGIHRYKRGNPRSLETAFAKAVQARKDVDREALRAVTEPYSIKAWCAEHLRAVELLYEDLNAGLTQPLTTVLNLSPEKLLKEKPEPMNKGTNTTRGIYCVAFGDPARKSALKMMSSAKKYMPDITIALCSDRAIGPEDILIVEPDSDVGARRNKLRAYELAPAEWTSVLYLDADTEVVADIRFYFKLIEDGWEFVICTDPHLDSMGFLKNRATVKELDDTTQKVMTLRTTQYNGGVWAFTRNAKVKRFFNRWLTEWEKYAQRDQGALTRAMYTEPLKVYLLGNEWNTFPRYTRGIKTAGLYHYPGRARRWTGMLPGRIDSPAAWARVKAHEAKRKKTRAKRRR